MTALTVRDHCNKRAASIVEPVITPLAGDFTLENRFGIWYLMRHTILRSAVVAVFVLSIFADSCVVRHLKPPGGGCLFQCFAFDKIASSVTA